MSEDVYCDRCGNKMDGPESPDFYEPEDQETLVAMKLSDNNLLKDTYSGIHALIFNYQLCYKQSSKEEVKPTKRGKEI